MVDSITGLLLCHKSVTSQTQNLAGKIFPYLCKLRQMKQNECGLADTGTV